MNKKQVKRIRGMANELPPMNANGNRTVWIHNEIELEKYAHIMDENTYRKIRSELKRNNGKRVVPINVSGSQPVDHYKRLKKIYKRFGIVGCEQYCDEVTDRHAALTLARDARANKTEKP